MELGTDSVVAVRTSQGTIRAFHNVCRHRGARILDGAGNCPGAITCPYHGWSYKLSGELIGMPARESFPGFDRSQFALKPVTIAGDVWFCVCVPDAGTPPPLEQIWSGCAQEFAPHRFEDMVPLGPLYIEHWDCDWKIAMDNYLESYHVPIGHPGLFRMFTPDYEDQTQPADRRCARHQLVPRAALIALERADVPAAGRQGDRRTCPRRIGGAGASTACCRTSASMSFPTRWTSSRCCRAGPGKCVIRGGSFALPDDRREMRIVRYLANRINRQVQREDEFLCRRVQQGLASGSYEPGPLSRLENCMLEFHDLLREKIPEARFPQRPRNLHVAGQPRCGNRTAIAPRNSASAALTGPFSASSSPAAASPVWVDSASSTCCVTQVSSTSGGALGRVPPARPAPFPALPRAP